MNPTNASLSRRLLIGAGVFYASYALGPAHFWLSFALLVAAAAAMYAPYGPFFAWIAESLPANVSGGLPDGRLPGPAR